MLLHKQQKEIKDLVNLSNSSINQPKQTYQLHKYKKIARRSSMSISTPSPLLDHLPPSEQLCYLHCNLCDTVLAVSVPCTSLFKTVTVRCGHCTNLLPVSMRGLLLSAANQFNFDHNFFSPAHNLLEEISTPSSNFRSNQNNQNEFSPASRGGGLNELPKPPVTNRPPEKRQRVPSAYNRFIKEEIQRIKAVNPDITHREAFSAAAKNWAHFPHIHYGFMPDDPVKKASIRRQDGLDDALWKDVFFASANVGVSPTEKQL